tara:strand:+ start:93 stop:638 length:546 start_codon:yes stop_codon:yes gene_type:complete
MKYLTKLISKSCIAVSLLLAISFSANAVLIKQDIFVDLVSNGAFQLGSIEIELDDNLLNTGSISSFDGGISLVELNIFGGVNFDFFDFEVIFDTDNLFAGIEFLAFDVLELDFVPGWSYQVEFDASNAGFAFIDIFDENFDAVGFGSVSLGQASVVSAPPSLALFSLTLIALYTRRKMLNA